MVHGDQNCLELDMILEENELVNGILRLMHVIRPQWPREKIRHSVFKDGITNKLVGVYLDGDEGNTILVRIYGQNTEKIIDRQAEIINLKILEKIEFSPKLYAIFKNGIAYQFLPGKTLNVETCRDERIYHCVARRMALLHKQYDYWMSHLEIKNRNIRGVFLWDKMELFLSLLPISFEDPAKQDRLKLHIPPVENLKEELEWMKIRCEDLNNQVVFCHNDLLLANILYDDSNNSVHFIDLEYAAPNYQAYDIANHFCEFAGVDDVDHSRYPDEEFRRNWISVYLKAFHQRDEVTEDEVTSLLDQVEKFSAVAHFFWGIWSLIQAAHSTIDFDFIGYSVSRLGEYFHKKSILQ